MPKNKLSQRVTMKKSRNRLFKLSLAKVILSGGQVLKGNHNFQDYHNIEIRLRPLGYQTHLRGIRGKSQPNFSVIINLLHPKLWLSP